MVAHRLISDRISNAPVIIFRVLFGFMMSVSIIRFWLNGWIEAFYISPQFHFKYFGFGWVHGLNGSGMYWIFGAMLLSAIAVTLGLLYRVAIIAFFLLFTYVELIDQTTYLNHYYFVSLIAFLLIFIPANKRLALDLKIFKNSYRQFTSAWTINILKFQLFVVYFYAGLAKLSSDWLLHAIPLKIWLPAKSHLPLIGPLLRYEETAYLFSWFGAAYDLAIPFLLLNRKTRPFAFVMVVIFHVSTGILFPIGMFPYIMILSTLIFFSATYHERIVTFLEQVFGLSVYVESAERKNLSGFVALLISLYVAFQLTFPFRFLVYPGKLFWHEQGYRFSWRVMLMEKVGNVSFHVLGANGKVASVNNAAFLTSLQEKEMSTQPDMILQFAHFLSEEFERRGFERPQVTAEGYVTLNGARSKAFIDSQVDLAKETDSWSHKGWIIPYAQK